MKRNDRNMPDGSRDPWSNVDRGKSPANPLLWAAVAAVLARPAGVYAAEASASTDTSSAPALEEVVVTATRREQSVLDVPYNIIAISGAAIDRANLPDLQSLSRIVPGLVIPDLGPRANSSNSNIVIRGLNTNDPGTSSFLPWTSVPLVSTYIDDVPLFVNLQLEDLARVEVLKGPQGTLYGSGAVGGTIRLIHKAPDPTKFSASTTVEGSKTLGAASGNYGVRGIVNIPVMDSAAVRLSMGYRRDAGFINAPNAVVFDAHGQPVLANPASPLTSGLTFQSLRDINDSSSLYARAAALWNIVPGVTAQLSFQHELDQAGAFQLHSLRASADENDTLLPHAPLNDVTNLGAVTLSADVGFATVTSSSSYSSFTDRSSFDNSPFIEFYNAASPLYYGGYPRVTSPFYNDISDKSFTEELRLVSRTGGLFDYTVGGFYRDQRSVANQTQTVPGFANWANLPGSADAVNSVLGTNYASFADYVTQFNGGTRPGSLTPADLVYLYDRHSTFKDKALFGELTWHVTSKWQVTGGARVFWQNFTQNLHQEIPVGGPFFSTLNPPDALGSTLVSDQQSFNNHIFKINTSYELSDTTRVYATFSEGFRHGGVNATPVGKCVFCDAASAVPFKPDQARNYEIGYKGTFGQRFRFSSALYRINWSDIQIQTSGKSGDNLVENGGKARSQGVEAELTAEIVNNLSATIGYTLADAKILDGFTIVDGSTTLVKATAGNRLPFVPRNTLTGSLDYRQPLAGKMYWSANLNASYRSDVQNALNQSQRNFVHLGGFTLVDASVGFGFNDAMSLTLFAHNLTDQLGATAGGAPNFTDARYGVLDISRPRTVGLRADYRFD